MALRRQHLCLSPFNLLRLARKYTCAHHKNEMKKIINTIKQTDYYCMIAVRSFVRSVDRRLTYNSINLIVFIHENIKSRYLHRDGHYMYLTHFGSVLRMRQRQTGREKGCV